jgi:hypothetical protein
LRAFPEGKPAKLAELTKAAPHSQNRDALPFLNRVFTRPRPQAGIRSSGFSHRKLNQQHTTHSTFGAELTILAPRRLFGVRPRWPSILTRVQRSSLPPIKG